MITSHQIDWSAERNSDNQSLTTPVVFLVFNRPATTRRVFEAISQARPSRLLIVADGPRRTDEGEEERCRQVRDVVRAINWPCQLETNFADENLGCQERVISGLNWAFSRVDEAVILEDDCLPHPTFFRFCQELLERYRNDSRVAMISGDSFVEKAGRSHSSYYFSRMAHIWGWATWRSAWQRYDRRLEQWPRVKDSGMLDEIMDHPRIVRHWTRIFDQMYTGTGPNTWDYQWTYTLLINNALSIVPRVNLVENIGFSIEGTHTSAGDPAYVLPARPMEFPLRDPVSMVPSRSLDHCDQMLWLQAPLHRRAMRKIWNRRKPVHAQD